MLPVPIIIPSSSKLFFRQRRHIYEAEAVHRIQIYFANAHGSWRGTDSQHKRPMSFIVLNPGINNVLLDDTTTKLALFRVQGSIFTRRSDALCKMVSQATRLRSSPLIHAHTVFQVIQCALVGCRYEFLALVMTFSTASEHGASGGKPATPSFCILSRFHAPLSANNAQRNQGYISRDGHQFLCKNPASAQRSFHMWVLVTCRCT